MDIAEDLLCVMLIDNELNNESEAEYIERVPRVRRVRGGKSGGEFIHRMVYEEPDTCKEQLRMTPACFVQLVNLLIDRGSLQDGKKVKIPEQVGMCLFILARGACYRDVKDKFKHGIAVVQRYHAQVLQELVKLSADVIRPYQDFNVVPTEITNSKGRYWPYFKVKSYTLHRNISYIAHAMYLSTSCTGLHRRIRRHTCESTSWRRCR